jgi:hypothetical protein
VELAEHWGQRQEVIDCARGIGARVYQSWMEGFGTGAGVAERGGYDFRPRVARATWPAISGFSRSRRME